MFSMPSFDKLQFSKTNLSVQFSKCCIVHYYWNFMPHLQLFQLFKQLCQEISKFAWSVKFYLLPVIQLSEFQIQISFLE